jgi:basic membrane lipoprotein Med (substrate-binding protein (PBP1-ABC) superfamily)
LYLNNGRVLSVRGIWSDPAQGKTLVQQLIESIVPLPAGLSESDFIAEEIFFIGLVAAPGGLFDNSLDQSAWQGVQEAAQQLDASVEFMENSNLEAAAADIQELIPARLERSYDS